MRRFALLGLGIGLVTLAGTLHCGGSDPAPIPASGGDAGADAPITPTNDGGPSNDGGVPQGTSGKVDLLLVVDNSASMDQKADILAKSIPTLVRGLVAPTSGAYAPVKDLHVGVISSSLGGFVPSCGFDKPFQNDAAHLLDRAAGGGAVAGVTQQHFVAYQAGGDVDAAVRATQEIVRGVGATGCGLEAQLEAAYRFLVEPTPPLTIDTTGPAAVAKGIDRELLAQRRAFLRPDSTVAVVLITDEDDSWADPYSIKGQGWVYGAMTFPGSTQTRAGGIGTTAPRGTAACLTDPTSPQCTSCAFAKSDPSCTDNGGFYGADDDSINVRFFDMKRRFGLDPQYPVARYARGFGEPRVPSLAGSHDAEGVYQAANVDCTNPLFAAALPDENASPDALCKPAAGTRNASQVFFMPIVGASPHLLRDGAGALKPTLATEDWTKLVGADPAKWDRSGQDVHMVQSIAPRPGLPGPAPIGDNGTDPIHGREWDTKKNDLQYACTFALPAPVTCALGSTCDCDGVSAVPLCTTNAGGREQIRAKSYPSLRPLELARALGDRAVPASICPAQTARPDDADFGYRPAFELFLGRMARALAK